MPRRVVVGRVSSTLMLTLMASAFVAVSVAGGSSVKSPSSRATLAIPRHTETWAYDDSSSPERCNGGHGASPRLVRRWLTYAETNCGPHVRKARRDCRSGGVTYCTLIAYFDASKVWPGDPVRKADSREAWWLHQPGYTDASHRLKETSGPFGTAYWLNQENRGAESWISHYVRSRYKRWAGLMLDETSACKRTQFYGSGYASSEELRTNAAVLREHADLARVLGNSGRKRFLQIDNGINPDPYVCSSLRLLDNRDNVLGLISEGRPWDHGLSGYYSGLLDVLAAVDARPKDFIVLLSYGANGSKNARLVQEATVLLGYAPGHVVSWADLEQNNHDLAVWPEEGIYPTDPIESMAVPAGPGCLRGDGKVCPRGGHNDLLVVHGSNKAELAAGVYRREFGECYNQGVPFGPCAAIVNDTSTRVTVRASWLIQSYGHEITLRGGDVQSGGRIETAGARFVPGQTRIPPDGAILLAQ